MHKMLIALVLALSLAGCKTVHIDEDNWSNPGAAVPAPKALSSLSTGGYRAREVWFHAADGTALHALLVSRPEARVTVLYLGGDSFQTGTAGPGVARKMESLGVNALLLDYPGYGGSEGKPGLDANRAAALAAYDQLQTLPETGGKTVVVWGMSLGGMLAPIVANARPAKGLVLESTSTNVADWAGYQVPWFAKPFVRFDVAPALLAVDNRKALARWNGPLFLLFGDADQITPPALGHALYQASATPASRKELYIAPNLGHGRALQDPAARNELKDFLDAIAARSAVTQR